MGTHKNLRVYKESMDFVTTIYVVTRNYPKEELFGLTSQTRRSSVSVPLNISEGSSRGSKKDFRRFLKYSLGSTSEIDTALTIAFNVGYLPKEDFNSLITRIIGLRKQLIALIKTLDNPSESP